MFLFVPAQNCLRSLKLLIRFGVPKLPISNSLDSLISLRGVIYYKDRFAVED
jgi:hypothetical protein